MKTIVDGQIIKKYQVPIDMIDELNKEYEKNKRSLHSDSEHLAGRLDTELSILSFLPKLKIFNKINFFIQDYMMSLNNFGLLSKPQIKTHIKSCWINDMKEGEYNFNFLRIKIKIHSINSYFCWNHSSRRSYISRESFLLWEAP